jgi:hypothetical protein
MLARMADSNVEKQALFIPIHDQQLGLHLREEFSKR